MVWVKKVGLKILDYFFKFCIYSVEYILIR